MASQLARDYYYYYYYYATRFNSAENIYTS